MDDVSKISLSGAVAALLWIDERQQRLGTMTALIRRGNKPDSSVPPQPSAPVIVAAPALKGAPAEAQPSARDLAIIGKKTASSCGHDGGKGEVEGATALSANSFLYAVRCPDLSGTYNSAIIFLIAPAGQAEAARPATFQRPPQTGGKTNGPGATNFLFNAWFTNADMTMGALAKGRGVGDCGSAERWVWDGNLFQLAELKTMPDCRGVPADDWPIVYRAIVR
jgi:hypothetical protein